ncbi:MAG: MGMT family protein [bacterium]
MPTEFTQNVVRILKRVPRGKVVTYGALAAYAGNPRGARQVVRILNTHSDRENLPWHRVINREGKISLGRGQGYELQKAKLEAEGVVFDRSDRIDLDRHLWSPGS